MASLTGAPCCMVLIIDNPRNTAGKSRVPASVKIASWLSTACEASPLQANHPNSTMVEESSASSAI